MSFEDIMREIRLGLTGDYEEDGPYLQEQILKHMDSEHLEKIMQECSRILYNELPVEKQMEFAKVMEEHLFLEEIEEDLEKTSKTFKDGDLNKAQFIIEELIYIVENNSRYEEKKFSFDETFEEVLYQYYTRSKDDIQNTNIPYSFIYFNYGAILHEKGEYEKSIEVLRKARKRNPINCKYYFEFMENYKALGDLEKYYDCTKKAFKTAFYREDLARCYRNMGYYLTEKKEYKAAIACYTLSIEYDLSQNAYLELGYIKSKMNGVLKEPTPEEVLAYSEKYEFPIGPDIDVVSLAYTLGKQAAELKEVNAAQYFLSIAYNLTNAKEIKLLMDSLG